MAHRYDAHIGLVVDCVEISQSRWGECVRVMCEVMGPECVLEVERAHIAIKRKRPSFSERKNNRPNYSKETCVRLNHLDSRVLLLKDQREKANLSQISRPNNSANAVAITAEHLFICPKREPETRRQSRGKA